MFESIENIEDIVLIENEDFFNQMLVLPYAIVYMLVNWSVPERKSRIIVSKVLGEIGLEKTPVFVIDCSDQTKDFVVSWLKCQTSKMEEFYYGGWGETLLVKRGSVIDIIKNPANFGMEETKSKIRSWLNLESEMKS